MTSTPPGWYPDGHGNTRYWNGTAWVDETAAPMPSDPPQQAVPTNAAETQPLHVAGVTGQVIFDGSFVTIARRGFRARAIVGKGEKRIPIRSITAVQWKPAGAMVRGFIQFTVPGGNERRSGFGHQTADAAGDENSVIFTKSQMPAFERLRTTVEQAINAVHTPQSVTQAQPAPMVDLAKLAELHAAGVLTDAEFTAAKAKALGI
jgi:hypothetical protein